MKIALKYFPISLLFIFVILAVPQSAEALMMPAPTTFPAGCYYKQVQCIKAPCNPILVCPSGTEAPTKVPAATTVPTQVTASGVVASPTTVPQADCALKSKGDANCDNVVNADDYVIWRSRYIGEKANLGDPDFNKDGKISLVDLEIWVRNIGKTISGTIAPTQPITAGPTQVVPTGQSPTDIPVPTELPPPTYTPGPSPTLIPVSGNTYYVSPIGSDSNNGTSLSTTFKSVSKAISVLRPGDILYLREGVYTENVSSVKFTPGRADAPITMKNFGNERPVIKGLFYASGASYWVFDGINVTWGTDAGSGDHMMKFTGGSEGWILKNCEIWGAHSYAAISITGFTKNWTIRDCVIHDTYKSNDTNQDHLIYANDASYGVIERNIFLNSENGRGVKLGPPSGGGAGPNNIIVRYNTFYNNTGPANIQVSGGTSNNTFEKNILVKPGAGQKNITVNSGYFGSNSVAKNNLGWQSSGMFETGIVDGGGNTVSIDPQINFSVAKRSDGSYILDSNSFKPANSAASGYGKYAP